MHWTQRGPQHQGIGQTCAARRKEVDGWMDGWLGLNGTSSTQVAAISCLKIGLDCAVFYVPANTV